MQCILLTVWLVSLAQITPTIPDDATVFTITYEKRIGEIAVLHAAIRAGGEFVESFDRRQLPDQVELVLDEPWRGYPAEAMMAHRIREAQPEPSFRRKNRYADSGFQQLESGLWVPDDAKRRADRMHELRENFEHEQERTFAGPVLETGMERAAPGGPGFFALWGGHVVILILAAISIALAVKICF